MFNRVIRFKSNAEQVIEELTSNYPFSNDDRFNMIEIIRQSVHRSFTAEQNMNLRTFKVFLSYFDEMYTELMNLDSEINYAFLTELSTDLLRIISLFRSGQDDVKKILNHVTLTDTEALNKLKLVEYVVMGSQLNWVEYVHNYQTLNKLLDSSPAISTITYFREHSDEEVREAQQRLVEMHALPFENVQQAIGFLSSVSFMKEQNLWFLSEDEYKKVENKLYSYLAEANFDDYAEYLRIPDRIRKEMSSGHSAEKVEKIIKSMSESDKVTDSVVDLIEKGELNQKTSFSALKDMGIDQVVFDSLTNKISTGMYNVTILNNVLKYMYDYYLEFSNDQSTVYRRLLENIVQEDANVYDGIALFNLKEHLMDMKGRYVKYAYANQS